VNRFAPWSDASRVLAVAAGTRLQVRSIDTCKFKFNKLLGGATHCNCSFVPLWHGGRDTNRQDLPLPNRRLSTFQSASGAAGISFKLTPPSGCRSLAPCFAVGCGADASAPTPCHQWLPSHTLCGWVALPSRVPRCTGGLNGAAVMDAARSCHWQWWCADVIYHRVRVRTPFSVRLVF
jgi:hypothetical protein